MLDLSTFGLGNSFQHDCHVWSDIDNLLCNDQELVDDIDFELLKNVQQSEVCKLMRKIRTNVEKALKEAKYKEEENLVSGGKCNVMNNTEKGKPDEETSSTFRQKSEDVPYCP